jgi:hypothetical protein
MLLEPWSSVQTARNNLLFLREFTADGVSSAGFCRTLPYAGTPIEEKLLSEGRLKERDFNADYNFLDPCLDRFYDWTLQTFAERNFSAKGTANLLRLLLYESNLKLPEVPSDPGFRNRVRSLTAVSNKLLIDATEAALDYIAETANRTDEDTFLTDLAGFYRREDERLHCDIETVAAASPGFQQRLYSVF